MIIKLRGTVDPYCFLMNEITFLFLLRETVRLKSSDSADYAKVDSY